MKWQTRHCYYQMKMLIFCTYVTFPKMPTNLLIINLLKCQKHGCDLSWLAKECATQACSSTLYKISYFFHGCCYVKELHVSFQSNPGCLGFESSCHGLLWASTVVHVSFQKLIIILKTNLTKLNIVNQLLLTVRVGTESSAESPCSSEEVQDGESAL